MGEPVSRPSELKNKHKRENLYQKQRLEKQKAKAAKRKALAKAEEKNPELKKVCRCIYMIDLPTHAIYYRNV
jgi:ribosome production factor 1